MRDTSRLLWAGPPRLGRADLARFARLASVDKSAGHQLASTADLPTEGRWLNKQRYTDWLVVVECCRLTAPKIRAWI